MIASQDRSGWFGASDTSMIMGNWNTKTFARFWAEKLGFVRSTFVNRAMLAGTYYEHPILKAIGVKQMDRQIRIRRLRLRVNLDGETKRMIHEVKTHSAETFVISKSYWQQCQVEMFAAGKACEIVSYRLLPDDYTNFFNRIDIQRIGRHPIERDDAFIERYLDRLEYLSTCLKNGRFPDGDHQRQDNRI